ncbi:hypothetical protein JZ751_006572 [Albula glossodonta]|uniref:Chemokine interleukin-8-like domain-containing protein n=1 Tax=Albula glossodonta TaxID=121402 RepID=A0A8T2N2R4_9TELE|nr:hypothetical protein JZ751_006572 [Albula glossodonta]
MAPRLLLLLLPLILLLWLNITCVAAIPKCCVTTSKNIDPAVLRKVVSVKFQSAGGVCEVDALV